jgi:RNA recognition motif-containing protein
MNEGKELNAKQVFVRNLAFDVTNDDLSALFEDIGPLKNTSVAATNGVGKGFGFVKFSLAEDAAAAIEKLQGSLFRGRKLILELGLKKERTTSKIKQQKQRREEEGGKGEEKGDDAVADADAEVEAEVEEEVPAETAAEAAVKRKAKFLAEKGEKQVARDVQAASVRRSRQLLIFGIPIDLNKRGFKTLGTNTFPISYAIFYTHFTFCPFSLPHNPSPSFPFSAARPPQD